MTKKVMQKSDIGTLAAVDLGSNSFHVVIGRYLQDEIRVIDKLSEKVQLALGLDKEDNLDEPSQQRALECLQRFSQRLVGIDKEHIRVIGTNTMRVAKNSQEFLEKAEQILGYPIEVVSGREEARLIYLGVSHTVADHEGMRLVIDIGGGSTELIVGERFEAIILESLHMGCVSFSKQFFPNGEVTEKRLQKAITTARQELLNVQKQFKKYGRLNCVGSSGSIRAIARVLQANEWDADKITRKSLDRLYKKISKYKHFDEIDLPGFDNSRRNTFHAGFAILYAVFEALNIDTMLISEGALREGAMYDLIGRIQHEDVRERTILGLMNRYLVDVEHANRVKTTALVLFEQVAESGGLNKDLYADMLRWAAMTHEIGLAISHTHFQQHGAYVMQFSDLPGFSRHEQLMLATLIRLHRRKFMKAHLIGFNRKDALALEQLALLLRFAVLIQRSRSDEEIPEIKIQMKENKIHLCFPEGWLESHPLTRADLEIEQEMLATEGYTIVLDVLQAW